MSICTALRLISVAVALPCAAAELTFSSDATAAFLGEGVSFGVTVYARGGVQAKPIVPRGKEIDWTKFAAPVEVRSDNDRIATGEVCVRLRAADGADYRCDLALAKDFDALSFAICLTLDATKFGGLSWRSNGKRNGVLPVEPDSFPLATFDATELSIALADGRTLRVAAEGLTQVQVYDNRPWGSDTFSFRMLRSSKSPRTGEKVAFAVAVGLSEPLTIVPGRPEVIVAGADWLPIDFKKDILAGSALDLSSALPHDVPAGCHGRVKAVGDHFEFERLPGVRQRFAGVNLCGDLNCPEEALAERLVTRYRRLGYNTVRFHHHESDLLKDSPDRLTFNAANIDRFDRQVKLLVDNGFYFTTDLYVSRPVAWRDIGFDREGLVSGNVYKSLVTAGYPPAVENWKTFARRFLTRRNAYTGRSLLEEPALVSLVLVNEAHLGMGWRFISEQPFLKERFAAWLKAKRAADPKFYPGVSENLSKLPNARSGQSGVTLLFHNEIEAETARSLIAWLRSIGCVTPIASDNNRVTVVQELISSEPFDVIDQHAYIDHPKFLGASWKSPCRYADDHPFKRGQFSFTRGLWSRTAGKPFTMSEWNFGGSSSYRSMAGLAIGAIAAVQGWGASWRFCYGHGLRKTCDNGGWVDSFEQTGDPLRQLTDLTFNLVYLRGDIAEAKEQVAVVVPESLVSPNGGKAQPSAPSWRNKAPWSVKTGLARGKAPAGWTGLPFGETLAVRSASDFSFDAATGTMTLSTPRTCGLFAEAGETVTAGVLTAKIARHRATLAVSSLDGRPIAQSARLLVTHLTNVLNPETTFADKTRTTVLSSGRGFRSRLVAAGEAEISLRLDSPETRRVWALATDGARLESVSARVVGDRLVFTALTAGNGKPRLAYEVESLSSHCPPADGDGFDLVVYGSTPAAVAAAVRASRAGLKAVIVSPERHIGGMTVSGLGFTDSGNTATIRGIAREFYRRIYAAYCLPENWRWEKMSEFKAGGQGTPARNDAERTMWTFEPHVAESVIEEWLAEVHADVRRGEFLDREKGVAVSNGWIRSVRTLSGNVYAGRYFIDATYEGDLMAAAGVPYRIGRESCSEYGETWNGNQVGTLHHGHHFRDWRISPYRRPNDPASGLCAEIGTSAPGVRGEADRRVQAYCYRLCMTDDPRNRLPFPMPPGYDPSRYELLARCYACGFDETFAKFDRIPNRKTDTNNHGPMNADFIGGSDEWPEATYARRRELAAAHRDYQAGLYYFLSHDGRIPEKVRTEMSRWGLAKDEFADNGGWPYQLYIREGRRMVGAYVMTEHDCLGSPRHPSQGRSYGPIAQGSYALDSHNVRRYVTADGSVQNEGDIGVRPPKPYDIDYGAIVPKAGTCANLLVPVALSATHTAFGSIRMEPVFMMLGDAAAAAAALARSRALPVQEVSYRDLSAGGGRSPSGPPAGRGRSPRTAERSETAEGRPPAGRGRSPSGPDSPAGRGRSPPHLRVLPNENHQAAVHGAQERRNRQGAFRDTDLVDRDLEVRFRAIASRAKREAGSDM